MALSSTSACGTTYLSTGNTTLSNYSTAVGPGSSAWQGLSTGNDTTAEYTSVANAAKNTSTTFYTVYQHNVTYSKGANVSAIGATSGSCKFVSSATANATTPNSCSVTLPTITANTGATAVGWSATNGATTGTSAGSSYTISSTTTTLYGNAKLKTYTVTVNVTNGTVDTSSKTVNYNTNATFTLTPSTGVAALSSTNPSISCTNSQTGSINTSTKVLSVGPVTANTTCTVKFELSVYSIVYEKGNYSSATGLPATQTKQYGQSIRLSYDEPTGNDNNTFLGWSTASSATASSTWYDGGTVYSDNANLNLKAQWYDVLSLEKTYSLFAKTSSFWSNDRQTVSFSNPSVGNAGGFSYTAPSPPSSATFRKLSVTGYNSMCYHRIYGVTYSSYKVRNLNSSGSNCGWNQSTLFIRDNSFSGNSNTYINTRIDNMLRDRDLSLKLSDISTVSFSKDNISIAKSVVGDQVSESAPSGYSFLSAAGYNIANASNNGTLASRCYLSVHTSSGCVSGDSYAYCTGDSVELNYSKSVQDIAPKIKITGYAIRIAKKTSTSSFDSSSHSTVGASRFAALNDLNSTKGNYIPRSNIKRSAIVQGATVSPAAWKSGTASKNISIPDGKILGVVEHGVSNGTNGSGESFSVINKAYVSGVNTTSGTFHMTFYGGNKKYTATAGNAMTNVYGWGYVLYISSGTMTIS